MFTPISAILKKSVASAGIAPQVRAARVVEAANAAIAEILRDPAQRAARALSFESGTLTVAVRSPIFSEEIKLRAKDLQRAVTASGAKLVSLKFLPGRGRLPTL